MPERLLCAVWASYVVERVLNHGARKGPVRAGNSHWRCTMALCPVGRSSSLHRAGYWERMMAEKWNKPGRTSWFKWICGAIQSPIASWSVRHRNRYCWLKEHKQLQDVSAVAAVQRWMNAVDGVNLCRAHARAGKSQTSAIGRNANGTGAHGRSSGWDLFSLTRRRGWPSWTG